MLENSDLVFVFGDLKLRYPKGDRVAQYLREGWFEANDLAFAAQFLNKGSTFIDVGAHAGLYSVIARSRVGPAGKIIAFEPNPQILPWLQKNLEVESTENLEIAKGAQFSVISVGLGASNKIEEFYIGKDSSSSAYASLKQNDDVGDTRDIQITTLDNAVQLLGLEKIDLIKVDIEGAESLFLDGAVETLSRFREIVILMEFSENSQNQFGETTSQLLRKLQSAGLRAFDVDIVKQSVKEHVSTQALWHTNLVLARNESLIKARLESADQDVKQRSIDIAQKGAAAMRLYQDRQDLETLLGAMEAPLRELADVQVVLTGNKNHSRSTAERLDKLSLSNLQAKKKISHIGDMLSDEVGRLSGAAAATIDRISANEKTSAELKAAMGHLCRRLLPLGEIEDQLTGTGTNGERVESVIRTLTDGNDDVLVLIGRFGGVLDDEVGRLSGMVTYLKSELSNKSDDVQLLDASIDRLREEIAQLQMRLDGTAEDKRKLLEARGEIQQMGDLALQLNRSRLVKTLAWLGAPIATTIKEIQAVYCATAEDPAQDQ